MAILVGTAAMPAEDLRRGRRWDLSWRGGRLMRSRGMGMGMTFLHV